nr:hypothetical protein [uncultured Campylobacter sp.]
MRALLANSCLDSPAPYAKDFCRFPALPLEKFGKNFRKRYRYGAPRLALRKILLKSPRNLRASLLAHS